jgi:hypothetical protein
MVAKMDVQQALLKHFLAAIAYRTQKALRGAPATGYRKTMTHVVQLAMLRRLASSPVPPENFVRAKISATNLGQDQPAPATPLQAKASHLAGNVKWI